MKLSHLSLAIFAAISLAACGGSSSNNQVTPEPQPQPQPQPQPEPQPGNDDEIVDPTGDEVVTYFNLETKSSQGTTQYLRNGESKFDRGNNPEEPASATSILGVDLNKQNPWFTNFVAARTKFSKDDGKNVTVAQYLGTRKTGTKGLQDENSLQSENFKNITRVDDIEGGRYSSATQQQIEVAKKAVKTIHDDYVKKLKDLRKASDTTEEEKAEIDQAIAAAEAQYKVITATIKAEYKPDPYITLTQDNNAGDAGDVDGANRSADGFIWGDGVAAEADGSKAAIGLVGMNFVEQDENGVNVSDGKTKKIQGTDDKAITSSRIFGRYFLADDKPENKKATVLDGNYNSYRKATAYVKKAAESAYPDVSKDNLKTEWGAGTYGIAVEPMELANVQYGRVTGKLDPANEPDDEAFAEGGTIEQREQFLARNNDEAVNYYFYRGTNAATIEQMNALPSDAILQYQGHALMYGIDNSYHGNGLNLPNSFGDTGATGIGNFVVAKYDVGQARVGGVVYNAWQFDEKAAELELDKLVEFGGKVTGNSVVGTANLLYKQAPTADFRASFFGDNAQELGGSFNSTTWQQKYGPKDGAEVWGGVFGAQRVDEPKADAGSTTIDNSWLGDIGADVRK